MRNATRNPSRSLLTAGLLASAAFLLVAVESFRREPGRDFLKKDGGSGGFPLLAQTDSPVFNDLNGEAMLTDIERSIQREYQREKRPIAEREAKVDEVRESLSGDDRFPVPRSGRRRCELLQSLPGRSAPRAGRAGVAHRPRRV